MNLFHRFGQGIEGVELPHNFNNPFYYSPHRLCIDAAGAVRDILAGNEAASADAAKGKMFGVLVVRDSGGELGFLAAFSGLLAGKNSVPGFVPPVFDMQSPGSYFKDEEARISGINERIRVILSSPEYSAAKTELEQERAAADSAVSALREQFARNKAARAAQRAQGALSQECEQRLIRESQFEKAELKRFKRACQERVAVKEAAVALFTAQVDALSTERSSRSAALQQWLFTQFKVLNACGQESSLLDIFKKYSGVLPPAGAGECAAPKLMQYAYRNGYRPLAMAEFWVGASPVGEVRRDGCFYGACKSKCEPILSFMLQGLDVEENALEKGTPIKSLDVVYEDAYIVVVNKPSGVLSVPGIVGGVSVQQWLRQEYIRSNELYVVHRLDMATSGLLVAAKSMDVYKKMQAMFASREVGKLYTALLSGVPVSLSGKVELPLAPDYENRPRQKVDMLNGKPAVTLYNVVKIFDAYGGRCSLVEFYPQTGRTHQLRVHAAACQGLDCPIVGDTLYGASADRLMLHASRLEFIHPVSGENVVIENEAPFVKELL